MTANSSKFDLAALAANLGWQVAGVSPPELDSETQNKFSQWLKSYKGPGLQYLERRAEERLNPRKYFPEAKSILCFGLYYFPGWSEGDLKVSNYAWYPDYHEHLKQKLEKTVNELKKSLGNFQHRIAVDTPPLLEKTLAVQAGLGWQGKNTLLLHPKFGSYLFLGEILTSLEPEIFQNHAITSDHCGTCRRCIEACPTEALQPYVLDAERCISYWNLEHRGDLEDAPSLNGWLAGCDICQQVCPWNQKLLPVGAQQDWFPNFFFQNLSQENFDQQEWISQVQSSALNYVPTEKWAENLEKISKN